MNPGYTTIMFGEEALRFDQGYAYGMKYTKNTNLLKLKNVEYNKMSRWHFLLNSHSISLRH